MCEMCMCLARDVMGGDWMRVLSLGFTNPVEREVVLTCVCVWDALVSVGSW